MVKLTDSPQWHELEAHAHMLKLPEHERNRFTGKNLFLIETEMLSLDYSRHCLTDKTKKLLIQLAEACDLKSKVKALFQGEPVNISENLPALHTALRDFEVSSLIYHGKDILVDIRQCFKRIQNISEKIRCKKWLGYSGKPITDIVHIGVGGSDLSQRMTCYALKPYSDLTVNIHFTANIDPDEMEEVLQKLHPETTLFIIASKSFSTQETLLNGDRAAAWLGSHAAARAQILAITACPEKAVERYGMPIENVLPVWAWVGGRYSIWSAMGLILAISIGFDHFEAFLKGAHAMDKHFQAMPFEKNMPVILALMGIWNINFFDCQTHAIIPYSQRLLYLVNHLQQLDMESNGKSLTALGEPVNYATGPIVWGGIGCNSQHSFHQLLHQGTHQTPVDFIVVEKDNQELHCQKAWLNANCQAQIEALTRRRWPYAINLITLKSLTPYTLGALMALYEHKIFVQSQIWGINPFDQPGVEESKQLASKIMSTL